MDGNGRWAEQRNMHRLEGHTQGIYRMISLVAHAFERGVSNVVCYGLSTENLERPHEEINHIYKLIIDVFELFVKTFTELRASVKYVGKLDALPEPVRESMRRAELALKGFESSGKKIYVAVAYGSRNEIVNAINTAIKNGESVTEESFLSMLSISVEPDLIIRTGGERRLSNFLLYQSSYSELYFSEKLFPEFGEEDLDVALEWYGLKNRKFGLI